MLLCSSRIIMIENNAALTTVYMPALESVGAYAFYTYDTNMIQI